MDIISAADQLGIKVDKIESSNKIRQEKRYYIIVHLIREEKAYMGSHKESQSDPQEAKRLALQQLRKYGVQQNDVISFKGMEVTYCDVPTKSVLKGNKLEMQPIKNRWLLPEELEQLLTN
jgi:hypothetical protein